MVEVFLYHARWCGPCQFMRKELEGIEYVVEVDTDDYPEEVSRVPYVLLMVDGERIKGHEGALTRDEFIDWMGEYDPSKSI